MLLPRRSQGRRLGTRAAEDDVARSLDGGKEVLGPLVPGLVDGRGLLEALPPAELADAVVVGHGELHGDGSGTVA